MPKPMQLGCKKCGGVITIELRPGSDRLEVRLKDGKFQEHFGKTQIECKKCSKPVAFVELSEAR